MKEVKTKNYFVLLLIIISTIIISLYLFSWYRQYDNNKINKPVITDILMEVKYNNLSNILQERDFLVVYMCTTSEKKCRSFESKFKDYITTNNLNDDIVYLNLGFKNDENDYCNKIYNKYKSNDLVKKVNKYPTLLIFKNGKIIDMLSSDDSKLTINEIEQFLKGYEI